MVFSCFKGTTIWSPLASGLLTGKYTRDGPDKKHNPDDSRLAAEHHSKKQEDLDRWIEEGKTEKMKKLEEFAKSRFNCSLAQLSLAWCAMNKHVSTVLMGATDPDQLKENLGAMHLVDQIMCDDMKAIDEILDNKPEPYLGWGSHTQKHREMHTLTGFQATNEQPCCH
jgi:aryl-alcohol dehydrogenase-like predicted oxidoreductase